MFTRDAVLEKIKSMPEEILKEVADFIDFIEAKREREAESQQFEAESKFLVEADMKEYLNNLEAYEEMLARGEIQWK